MTASLPSVRLKELLGGNVVWKDKQGFIHACDGDYVHHGIRLIWTLCERDVPAGNAFMQRYEDKITCATCLMRLTPNAPLTGATTGGKDEHC